MHKNRSFQNLYETKQIKEDPRVKDLDSFLESVEQYDEGIVDEIGKKLKSGKEKIKKTVSNIKDSAISKIKNVLEKFEVKTDNPVEFLDSFMDLLIKSPVGKLFPVKQGELKKHKNNIMKPLKNMLSEFKKMGEQEATSDSKLTEEYMLYESCEMYGLCQKIMEENEDIYDFVIDPVNEEALLFHRSKGAIHFGLEKAVQAPCDVIVEGTGEVVYAKGEYIPVDNGLLLEEGEQGNFGKLVGLVKKANDATNKSIGFDKDEVGRIEDGKLKVGSSQQIGGDAAKVLVLKDKRFKNKKANPTGIVVTKTPEAAAKISDLLSRLIFKGNITDRIKIKGKKSGKVDPDKIKDHITPVRFKKIKLKGNSLFAFFLGAGADDENTKDKVDAQRKKNAEAEPEVEPEEDPIKRGVKEREAAEAKRGGLEEARQDSRDKRGNRAGVSKTDLKLSAKVADVINTKSLLSKENGGSLKTTVDSIEKESSQGLTKNFFQSLTNLISGNDPQRQKRTLGTIGKIAGRGGFSAVLPFLAALTATGPALPILTAISGPAISWAISKYWLKEDIPFTVFLKNGVLAAGLGKVSGFLWDWYVGDAPADDLAGAIEGASSGGEDAAEAASDAAGESTSDLVAAKSTEDAAKIAEKAEEIAKKVDLKVPEETVEIAQEIVEPLSKEELMGKFLSDKFEGISDSRKEALMKLLKVTGARVTMGDYFMFEGVPMTPEEYTGMVKHVGSMPDSPEEILGHLAQKAKWIKDNIGEDEAKTAAATTKNVVKEVAGVEVENNAGEAAASASKAGEAAADAATSAGEELSREAKKEADKVTKQMINGIAKRFKTELSERYADGSMSAAEKKELIKEFSSIMEKARTEGIETVLKDTPDDMKDKVKEELIGRLDKLEDKFTENPLTAFSGDPESGEVRMSGFKRAADGIMDDDAAAERGTEASAKLAKIVSGHKDVKDPKRIEILFRSNRGTKPFDLEEKLSKTGLSFKQFQTALQSHTEKFAELAKTGDSNAIMAEVKRLAAENGETLSRKKLSMTKTLIRELVAAGRMSEERLVSRTVKNMRRLYSIIGGGKKFVKSA